MPAIICDCKDTAVARFHHPCSTDPCRGSEPRPLPPRNCRFLGTLSALNQFRRSITNHLRRRKRDLVEMENSLPLRMLVVSQILDEKLPLAALAMVHLSHGGVSGRGISDAAPTRPANDFRLGRYPNTTAARRIGSESCNRRVVTRGQGKPASATGRLGRRAPASAWFCARLLACFRSPFAGRAHGELTMHWLTER